MKPGVVRILWIVYFLCVIPALVTLYHRAQFDKGFNSVALVADYVQLLELAQTENVPVDEILARVKDEAGIDHIALLEDTPIFLQQRGLCTIVEGVGWPGWKTPEERDEIEKNRGREVEEASAPELDFPLLMGLSHDKNHLIFEDHEVFARIAETAQARYPGLVDVTDLGDDGGIVSLAGEPKIVLEWGLGFDSDLVTHLESLGFKIYPRLRNYAGYSTETIESTIGETLEKFPSGFFIFDGDSIPGNGYLKDFLESGDVSWKGGIGWIEFAEQKGANILANALPNNSARVHSIEDEEMEVITVDRAVDRYLRAVRERTIRIVYLKPFLLQTDKESRIEKTIAMFKGVREELESKGFKIGEPSVIRDTVKSGIFSRIASYVIYVFGLLLLFLTLGYDFEIQSGRTFVGAVYFFLVLLFVMTGYVSLGIAIVSPTLAFTWLIKRYDVINKPGFNPIGPAVLAWLGACAITLAGALLISASSINTTTLIAIDTFSGVKVALYLPILIAILIGVQLILPEGKRTIKDGIAWLLSVNIQIWHVLLGIVGLVLLFIMVDRSGNFPIIDVADWENKVRGWFETALYARPRTKEMFFGHPGMIILMMLGFSSLKIRRALMYAGVVIGSVALTSMTNTFCHFHTPILLSIWRTVGGLVIGGVIGIVAGIILLGIKKMFSRKPM